MYRLFALVLLVDCAPEIHTWAVGPIVRRTPTANQSPDVETSLATLELDMHDGSDRSMVVRGERNRGQRARCSGRRIASRPLMIGMEA